MADEALEVNTAVEDLVVEQQVDEAEVSAPAAHSEWDSADKSSPAAESSWSAPILSLARKATESIGGGMRKPSQGSEQEPEHHLNNSPKKSAGMSNF